MSSCGSAATTSCRAWRAPFSSAIPRTIGTRCSFPTGSSTRRFRPIPSPLRRRPGPRAPRLPGRIRLRQRLPRNDRQEKAMNKLMLLAAVAAIAVPLAPAAAWFHGGSWSASTSRGGYASGGGGSWSAHGYRGGTASGGDGSWSGTGYRGGTASGGGGSWHATGSNGNTYYGGPDYWHGGYYGRYNSPTVVNAYGANCYNCGGWNTGGAVAAGVVAGAAVGAAAANSANNQSYAAGYAAGSAATAANPPGTLYGTLPAGCTYRPIGSQAYYSCSNGLWFQPAYGANGVYYRVVTAP